MTLQDTPFHFIEFDEVDSTSGFLKTELKAGNLSGYNLCTTLNQTGGYGQRGREWVHSGSSLAFSLSIPFELPIHLYSFLSSSIALLLRDCLAQNSSELFQVKWPNDVFVPEGKVAGSLIELTTAQATKQTYLVIGVGVNLSEIKDKQNKFKAGWVSDLNRERFLIDFSSAIYVLFSMAENSLNFKLEEWLKHDFFSPNQPVIVYHSDHSKVGLYKGLTPSAEVQVEIEGYVETYQSGAVSIRPITSEQT